MILLKQKNILFSAQDPQRQYLHVSEMRWMSLKTITRPKWLMPWGPNQCDKIRDIEEAIPREIEANDIVFSVHIPSLPWRWVLGSSSCYLSCSWTLHSSWTTKSVSALSLPLSPVLRNFTLFSLFRASCNRREIIVLLVAIIDCFLLTRCVSECSTWISPFYFPTSS